MTNPDLKAATVEQYGAYHLVTYGTWQVTVDNVGMIKLPALVSPDTVDDLIGALVASEPVARQQREDNATAQRQANDFFAAQRAASQEKEAAVRGARQTPAASTDRRKQTPAARARSTASKASGPRGARQTPAAKAAAKKAEPAKAQTPVKAAKKAPAKRVAQKRNG